MLTLWNNDSKSSVLVKDSFDIVSKAVVSLNPGQWPVIAFDQPLLALVKKIQ